MPTFNDLSGHRFGRLTAISREPSEMANTRWRCACDCGSECVVIGSKLRSGHTKSCGCFRAERARETHRQHGMTGSTTFYIWQHMVSRCTNPKDPAFANYGGRGISVCEAWLSFDAFLADMGVRPEDLTLDRRDNEKGYEPENCRWVTRKVQANNNRRNVVLQLPSGERMTLAEFCDAKGLPYHSVKSRRLRHGSIPGVVEVRR